MSKDKENSEIKRGTTRMTVSVAEHIAEEWQEEYEEGDWSNRSEYFRTHVEAGRKQLARLHPKESSESNTLHQEILNNIPENDRVETEDDLKAPDAETIIGDIVDPMEAQIYETIEELDDGDQIAYRPRLGGYVKL